MAARSLVHRDSLRSLWAWKGDRSSFGSAAPLLSDILSKTLLLDHRLAFSTTEYSRYTVEGPASEPLVHHRALHKYIALHSITRTPTNHPKRYDEMSR